jgi:hypothetical protein
MKMNNDFSGSGEGFVSSTLVFTNQGSTLSEWTDIVSA